MNALPLTQTYTRKQLHTAMWQAKTFCTSQRRLGLVGCLHVQLLLMAMHVPWLLVTTPSCVHCRQVIPSGLLIPVYC